MSLYFQQKEPVEQMKHFYLQFIIIFWNRNKVNLKMKNKCTYLKMKPLNLRWTNHSQKHKHQNNQSLKHLNYRINDEPNTHRCTLMRTIQVQSFAFTAWLGVLTRIGIKIDMAQLKKIMQIKMQISNSSDKQHHLSFERF